MVLLLMKSGIFKRHREVGSDSVSLTISKSIGKYTKFILGTVMHLKKIPNIFSFLCCAIATTQWETPTSELPIFPCHV